MAGSGQKGRLWTSYLIFLKARWPVLAEVGVLVVLDWEADQPACGTTTPRSPTLRLAIIGI